MRPAPGIAMASARTSARAAVAHHPVIAPKLIWRRAEVITVLICDSEAVSQAAVARCGEGFPGRRILNGRFTPRSKPSAEPCATSKELILKALKADIVHCIALRGILVGGTAAAMAGIPRRIFALTGLGLLGAREDATGRLSRLALKGLISAGLLPGLGGGPDPLWGHPHL